MFRCFPFWITTVLACSLWLKWQSLIEIHMEMSLRDLLMGFVDKTQSKVTPIASPQ
jgi:hypothetical protein